MKIGSRGHYAVIAMSDLACRCNVTPTRLSDISDSQGIPLTYLEQLFCGLRRAGLVRGIRGAGGGYVLAKDSAEITIADIMAAAGESTRTNRCGPEATTGCTSRTAKCRAHDLWSALGDRVELFLAGVSLEDLCEGRFAGHAAPGARTMASVGAD